MATNDDKLPRKYSLFISVRLDSVTAEEAQKIEDAIRDIADDYQGADVQSSKSAERPQRTG